jgi:hypothetical protein
LAAQGFGAALRALGTFGCIDGFGKEIENGIAIVAIEFIYGHVTPHFYTGDRLDKLS